MSVDCHPDRILSAKQSKEERRDLAAVVLHSDADRQPPLAKSIRM
jgi:hypothetical protein